MSLITKVSKLVKEKDISEYFGVFLSFILASIGLYIFKQRLHLDDAFWHIKAGEWIENQGFIQNCYGSWISKNEEWIAHEWLFDIIIYNISKLGMNAIVVTYDILYLLIIGISLYLGGLFNKSEKFPVLYVEVVLVIQVIAFAMCTTARPQYITVLMVALFFLIINKSLQKKPGLLFILPLLTVFWVNVHGGTTLLSYFIIIIYLICNSFDYKIGKIEFKKAELTWRIICASVLVLCIIGIMLNPYGFRMLKYPYENMQDKLMVSFISEWSSPDPKNIVVLCFFLLPIFLGMVSLIQYKDEIKSSDVALFFMFTILFLRSQRFYPFLVVAQTSLVTKYGFYLPPIIKKKEKKVNRFANNIGFIIVGIVTVSAMGYNLITVDYTKITGNKIVTDKLIEIIKNDNPQRIFNHYDAGGYLLYNNIEVFVDGRYEPYRKNEVINDFVKLAYPRKLDEYREFDELIEKYKFDSYLLKKDNGALIIYLESHESIECIYNDDEWIYMIDKSYKVKN